MKSQMNAHMNFVVREGPVCVIPPGTTRVSQVVGALAGQSLRVHHALKVGEGISPMDAWFVDGNASDLAVHQAARAQVTVRRGRPKATKLSRNHLLEWFVRQELQVG